MESVDNSASNTEELRAREGSNPSIPTHGVEVICPSELSDARIVGLLIRR